MAASTTPAPRVRWRPAFPRANRLSWAPVLLSGLLTCCATFTSPAPRVPESGLAPAVAAHERENLRVFDAAWSLVARKYYDPTFHGIDWDAAARTYGPRATAAADRDGLYGSINAMIGLLQDSHTYALSPARAVEYHTHRRIRSGFGLLRIGDSWVVTDVVPDSPAARAGVKAGWLVRSRNGTPLSERADFHPQEDEVDRWEFLDRDDRPVSLQLATRMLSTAARREARPLAGGAVYLRFDEFSHDSRQWLRDQLRIHRDAPALVIDLRYNPGGGTFWMREMVADFFALPVNVGTFTRRGKPGSPQNSWELGSADYGGRVAVLVGAGTASAAEIFSAVLQVQRRATIVGRRTAGAVLASRFYRLPDRGELQLSVEDYVSPAGHRLEGRGQGVTPDVPVALTLPDVRTGRDRDLEAALRTLAAS